MKRFFILIFLIPQLLYAQFQSKEFTLPIEEQAIGRAIGLSTSEDSIISLDITQPISGLFISGFTTFENENDSYTRVTVKDKNYAEYLVYENYPLISDSNYSRFSKVAVESMLLDGIVPISIKIELHNASIQIDSIYTLVSNDMRENRQNRMQSIRHEQTLFVAKKLNNNLMARHMTWIAGPTSIASKSYEEKKKIFGSKVPCLYGFEYYKGGLYFINPIPPAPLKFARSPFVNNPFVRDYDWRNRHGKNWITSVKSQGNFGTCWAHASIATVESNFNIYYNQVFPDDENNNDLSEQELISCLDNDNKSILDRLNSGFSMYALDYIQRNGIVREECMPYFGPVSCSRKCNNPQERVSFSSFRNLYKNNRFDDNTYIYNDSIADILRLSVIKSPVVVDYFKLVGHSVSCVGFHQIQMGDTICGNINTSYEFVVDSTTSHFVDMISWIIKNSWGDDWGENGFAKVSFYTVPLRLYEITPPFTSLVYSDNSRYLTDEDMDGYYTWGSGPKPSNCPSWIPDEPDGDDSDYQYGPMDSHGNLEDLELRALQTLWVETDYTFTARAFWYNNTVVCGTAKLTIKSPITLYGNTKIIVEPNGELVIDGGTLQNADIELNVGSRLVLRNGGTIIMRNGTDFFAPIGATVNIENGLIK